MPVAAGPTPRFPAGLLAVTLSAGEIVVRIHRKVHGPIFFGPRPPTPPQSRFDAPSGEYGTIYTAQRLEGAFVETILRRPGRLIRREFVEERMWTPLRLNRTMTLAKVMDEGLQFHRVDASVSANEDYGPPQTLALELHIDFSGLDGIVYRSRYNNGEICHAFFNRVADSDFTPMAGYKFEDERLRTDELMSLYGAVFDTSKPIV